MAPADGQTRTVSVLAPIGRDAQAIAGLAERAGLSAAVCSTPSDLVQVLEKITEVAVVAEEALYGTNLAILEQWVADQPIWSDQPFIILTTKNEGPRFFAFRRDLVARLRNVTFLERPFQGLTLQATILAAERARRRQYEARTYLAAQLDVATRLEELIAERTQNLEQANTRLRDEIANRERAQAALFQSQKIESLGQLVGGVAHDFNNLLMAVIGNLDLLSKRLEPDPKLSRLLNGAMEGARRGASLTQRLLAFARKQELQARATDVVGLVNDMEDLIHRSVGPLVQIDIEAEDNLPPVTVDPNQLEMALLNLAVNARDAMPRGGVLRIGVARELSSGSEADLPSAGDYVRLSVADMGEGMDADTLARAVEPFFTTKAVGKGTGLGLSMVFGLAEQSGGALRLESVPGRGTTAHLWLPVAIEDVGNQPATVAPPQASLKTTILLVDDDVLIAESTAALLEDLGHVVTRAGSGEEALQRLNEGLEPDLMITDYAMPGMTGLELGRAVRRLRPALSILLATGFAELDEAGLAELPRLAKPYTQGQLAAEIARALAGRAR